MKYERFKQAMDSSFQTVKGGHPTLDIQYLTDMVELTMKNIKEYQVQIYNTRVRPHTPVLNALVYECAERIKDYCETEERPFTKQIEKYFNEYGYDYKEVLKPLVDMVIDIRSEN